ncbi:MAG: hypothetical protein H6R19_249 [Proteobacteria bacterium]|nr:hypothetical protein [Pseudomonadota bacterium]
MATSPIHKLFGQSEILSRLQDHANRLIRLQRTLESALPAASSGAAQVANFQEGTLTIHVASPVMATRLKLGLESLKSRLQAAGEPVESITVKVRTSPFQGRNEQEEAEVRPIGSGGRAALLQLSEGLKPDDPLALALKRMVERSATED